MLPRTDHLQTHVSFAQQMTHLRAVVLLFLVSLNNSGANKRPTNPHLPSYMGGTQRHVNEDDEAALQPHLHKIVTDGDLIFGGLFPMHEEIVPGGTTCGKIKIDKGVQRLEAMLYAVDLLNRDPNLLPDLTIGLHILDTCGDDTFGLEQSMDFIKAQLSNIDIDDYWCKDMSRPQHHPMRPVVGVIGAANSPVSIMVANILRLFKVRSCFFVILESG